MARNGSGTHSLPTGNPVVAGTAADPVAFNATMSDISAEITDSLSRSGKGGMSAPLVVTAGSAAAPSIAPTGDADTGIYAPAANEIGITTGGTQRVKVSSSALTSAQPVHTSDGAVGAPSHSFTSDTDTGAYLAAAGDYRIAVAGADHLGVTTTAIDAKSKKITNLANGSAATDAATYGQAGCQTITVTAASGWTLNTAACFKIGTLVVAQIKATAGATPDAVKVGTVAAGSRPAANVQFYGSFTDASPAQTLLLMGYVTTGGDLQVTYYTAVEATYGCKYAAGPTYATGDVVEFTAMWAAA